MQGVHEWIRLFKIVFAAYCCGIFVPGSVVVYITFHLLSVRGFKVFQMLATECSECGVLLLFRHNFMFISP